MRCVHSGKHFLVDFLAACPYDLLVKTAGGSVRYQAWVRIPKLLRLHRVVVWYQKKVQASAPFPCASMNMPQTCSLSLKPLLSCKPCCTRRLQKSEHVLLSLLSLHPCLQESEIDADSIRSRFRFLIPIMLGACHVMACVLWYVGTYKLPTVAQADADAAGTDPTSMDKAQNYQNLRNTTWLGGYSGKLFRA